MDLAVPTLSDATYPGLDVNEDLSPREWSREKQAYHTSSLGITGLQNSYLVQRNTRHQLIVGLLDVSLQSFFLASHYFPEKTQLITCRDYQGAVSVPMCITVCRGTFLQVLGTPTREEIQCMNPGYTDFRLPQIKAHPWHKVFHKRMPPEAIDLAS